MLRVKLNEIYSRALTIAVRILGQDCYVEFEYAEIELKPDSELEAYKAMKQARILELLSLGLITDEEASLKLTGNLQPAGYKPLMGTMFKTAKADTGGNPDSNTSAMDKTLTSDTPPLGDFGRGMLGNVAAIASGDLLSKLACACLSLLRERPNIPITVSM